MSNLLGRVGARRGEHALDPVVLARALDAAEDHLRLGHARLDRVVGGAQHAGVVLGAAEEGPARVGLVEDLPVVDRPARVGGDLARELAPTRPGRAARRGAPSRRGRALGQPARRAADDREQLYVVAPRELDHAIEWLQSGWSAAAAEDAVQLDVDAHVLGSAGLGLLEHPLLERIGRAAGVELRRRGDRAGGGRGRRHRARADEDDDQGEQALAHHRQRRRISTPSSGYPLDVLEGLMQHDHPLTLQLMLERMRRSTPAAEVVSVRDGGAREDLTPRSSIAPTGSAARSSSSACGRATASRRSRGTRPSTSRPTSPCRAWAPCCIPLNVRLFADQLDLHRQSRGGPGGARRGLARAGARAARAAASRPCATTSSSARATAARCRRRSPTRS